MSETTEMEAQAPAATQNDGKIGCAICGARTHTIASHLKEAHPTVSIEDYKSQFPDAPLLSEKAMALVQQKAQERNSAAKVVASESGGFTVSKKPMHEVFQLGPVKAAMSHQGGPIPISVLAAPEELGIYIPDVDPNYIFNIDLLKTVLLGLEARFNTYLWGHAGVGKTTIIEQACAHTKRPWIRVQHTRNMEESHVVGQWVVRDGHTVFELGPLPFAMKYGLTYVADEYDFAMPAVLSLYQPVLEGKTLVIKDADQANRIIRPHPQFRFCATGNTNGTGDETGLYAGTLMQNAANYERFAIVEEVRYPEKKIEIGLVAAQGGVPTQDAEQLVSFANLVRESFTNGKIGLPVSPRALINAAQLGRRRGSIKTGLGLAYVNRLSRVDQQAVREIIDRMSFS